jgi:DNA-binding NarL/FixJ family response regulator
MALPFNPLRVLIVADDQLSRAGLTAMLAQQSQVEVVGQATGDDDIDSLLEVYLPHVLVWDLGWNPVGSLASLSQLTEAAPPVLALLADDSLTAQAHAAGARGLLLRNTNID